jgi:carbamoyltransferase
VTEWLLAVHPATDGFGSHDPSAVLFADGYLVFGVEEARLARRKRALGTFPGRAIRACLDYGDLTLSDVGRVLLPWARPVGRDADTGLERIAARLSTPGERVPPIRSYDHHRCHAASAYLPSGFDDALVLTVDGRGGRHSTVVWSAKGETLRRVATYDPPNSLGYLYGAVAGYLNLGPYGGEGKVMGLAPYGSGDTAVESRLRSHLDAGADYDVTSIVGGGLQAGIARLADLFDYRPSTPPDATDGWETDLAHATQQYLEDTVLAICERYCERLGHAAVCLAGGVALNCTLNRRIAESPAVDRLFVQPVAGDAGAPIGAGLLAAENPAVPSTLYWGPTYSRETVARALDRRGVGYDEPENLVGRVAELLAEGAVVGWFQGRLEMGPRALGNRSILADPRSEDVRARVNAFVKRREAWRPFAPSLLARAADEYLRRPRPAPYMIQTFETRSGCGRDIPATVHPADGTVRPQVVREGDNPRFHRLVSAFADRTGVPAVLNTSFNVRGEPIVATPAQALDVFRDTALDALVVKGFLVERDGSLSTSHSPATSRNP